MASLYKRKDGSPFWWISYSENERMLLGLKSNGESTRKKSRRQAEYVLKDKKEQISNSSFAKATSRPEEILFSEVLEKYIEMKKSEGFLLNPKTITLYKKALKIFFEVNNDLLPNEYERKDYRNYINYLDVKEYSQNTKAMYTGRITSLFNWLKKEEFITKHYFETTKESKKDPEILTRQEIQKLLSYAKETKFYFVVKFMLLSAFRASEALIFNKNNIMKDKIFVRGKGNKPAHIPITPAMKIFLKELPQPDEQGCYFPDFKYIGLRKFFQRASKKLGFKIESHDMRRYRISRIANNGTNLLFVMKYARHSKIEMTMRYVKVDFSKMLKNISDNQDDDLD